MKIGDKVKVNISVVKQYDSIPPYIRLVNSIIKDSENGIPEVVGMNDTSSKSVEIASWEIAAIFKSAFIPIEACTVIK